MGVTSVRRIELCGVALDVVTDHPALARYLEGHFAHLQPAGAAAGDPDVSVRVRWTEGPRDSVRPETVFPGWQADTMIHRDVHVGPNRVVWLRVDDVASLAIASEHGGRTRRFELCFHFSLGSRGWRERLKRAVYRRKVPALRRSRLSTLTYYAVYYPVWWQLESRGAGHPLHAAGVAIDGRALVLAAILGMIEPEAQAHVHERAARLERLLAGVPCYVLEVREGAPAEAVAVLRDLVTPVRQLAR